MKLITDNCGVIDMRNTMYPSIAHKVHNQYYSTIAYSTVYGYVLDGTVTLPNGWVASSKQYFSLAVSGEEPEIEVSGTAVFFARLGHRHQNNLGGPIEESGRLCYIDGCSDSLLVYPSRQGDPSLNLLAFPPGIDQTFHIHPSIRFGVVASGAGKACFYDSEVDLVEGAMFCIEEREYHRFRTPGDSMRVIAYHPDGDWGPTDENHTMLNRTYILDKSTK